MKESYALVTVRTLSTRLPEKCLQPIVEDISVIQVVIRRAKKVGCQVVLTTTDDPSDDRLVEIARSERVKCFRGAQKNKILRWADCFAEFDIDEGLLVDGDDPTFDFNVGARALGLLKDGTAELVISGPDLTPGFFTYGITRQGIEKLSLVASDPLIDTDVITEFIKKTNLVKACVQPQPRETIGHNVRLTIDYPEDLEFYRELYKRIDYLAPGPAIVRAALRHRLQKINWHKHEEFLENQQAFNRRTRTDLNKSME